MVFGQNSVPTSVTASVGQRTLWDRCYHSLRDACHLLVERELRNCHGNLVTDGDSLSRLALKHSSNGSSESA